MALVHYYSSWVLLLNMRVCGYECVFVDGLRACVYVCMCICGGKKVISWECHMIKEYKGVSVRIEAHMWDNRPTSMQMFLRSTLLKSSDGFRTAL